MVTASAFAMFEYIERKSVRLDKFATMLISFQQKGSPRLRTNRDLGRKKKNGPAYGGLLPPFPMVVEPPRAKESGETGVEHHDGVQRALPQTAHTLKGSWSAGD